MVEELGPGCSRLREGDRVGALTVWGADAERVCVPEAYAVEVPEDLDPAEVASLVFPYMTAYQMLHRTARVKTGETVLVHGAAGRVGTAALELGALAGLRLIGTASARDRAAVERLGAAGDWRLGRSAGVTGAGTQASAIVDGSERELIVLQGARWSSQAGVSVSKRKCSLNARSASDLEHHGRCTGSCT